MLDTVLFKLDGTIIDTHELIVSSFQHVLKLDGRGHLLREQIVADVHTTLEQKMKKLLGKEDVTKEVIAYYVFIHIHYTAMTRLLPLVKEVIVKLYERGIRIAVLTTKPRSFAEHVLMHFDLFKYINTIVTSCNSTKCELDRAVNELDSSRLNMLIVCALPIDIQLASAMGVRCAALASSVEQTDVLQQYKPDYIMNRMTDLYAILGTGMKT